MLREHAALLVEEKDVYRRRIRFLSLVTSFPRPCCTVFLSDKRSPVLYSPILCVSEIRCSTEKVECSTGENTVLKYLCEPT